MRRQGFTLVEISIVLVIIALLVGGMLVGKSLIQTSKLQTVIADFNDFKQAALQFKDKYNQLPGDLTNATSYWGTDPAGCPGTYTATPHVETCNGNGNNRIGDMTPGYNLAIGSVSYDLGEWLRAWQHMANAGLIRGQYSGTSSTAATGHPGAVTVIGVNVPASKIENAGYTLFFAQLQKGQDYSGKPGWWLPRTPTGIYGHTIGLGTQNIGIGNWTHDAALTPVDAKYIDTKMDDGSPALGNLRTFGSFYMPNCTTSDVQDTTQYNTIYPQIACNLLFLTGF